MILLRSMDNTERAWNIMTKSLIRKIERKTVTAENVKKHRTLDLIES